MKQNVVFLSIQQVYVGIGGAFSFNEACSELEYFKDKAEFIKKKKDWERPVVF